MRAQFTRMLLVVISIIGILGHVCVAFTDHAPAAASQDNGHHDADRRAHDPDRQTDDGIHIASCEALSSTTGYGAVAGHDTREPQIDATPVPCAPVRIQPVNLAAKSPPLYVLHAALLI